MLSHIVLAKEFLLLATATSFSLCSIRAKRAQRNLRKIFANWIGVTMLSSRSSSSCLPLPPPFPYAFYKPSELKKNCAKSSLLIICEMLPKGSFALIPCGAVGVAPLAPCTLRSGRPSASVGGRAIEAISNRARHRTPVSFVNGWLHVARKRCFVRLKNPLYFVVFRCGINARCAHLQFHWKFAMFLSC